MVVEGMDALSVDIGDGSNLRITQAGDDVNTKSVNVPFCLTTLLSIARLSVRWQTATIGDP
jgi:hypothetical protein